jgi:hypothetical protein
MEGTDAAGAGIRSALVHRGASPVAEITPVSLPFTPPTTDEARALRVASDYLVRAGAEAARRLLTESEDDADWLATVSDSLHAGALLCCAELIGSPTPRVRRTLDGLEPSALQVAARFVLLVALFVVREIASGALEEAGKEQWTSFRQHRRGTGVEE